MKRVIILPVALLALSAPAFAYDSTEPEADRAEAKATFLAELDSKQFLAESEREEFAVCVTARMTTTEIDYFNAAGSSEERESVIRNVADQDGLRACDTSIQQQPQG